jgi:CRISPR/Cas system-associated protein Cas10 (large subunit of type III CRISPR-Cas system)
MVLQFNATRRKKRKEKKRKFVISLYAYASIINATSYLSKKPTAVNSSHLIITAESGKRTRKRKRKKSRYAHPPILSDIPNPKIS